jgi:hypothetical protein
MPRVPVPPVHLHPHLSADDNASGTRAAAAAPIDLTASPGDAALSGMPVAVMLSTVDALTTAATTPGVLESLGTSGEQSKVLVTVTKARSPAATQHNTWGVRSDGCWLTCMVVPQVLTACETLVAAADSRADHNAGRELLLAILRLVDAVVRGGHFSLLCFGLFHVALI